MSPLVRVSILTVSALIVFGVVGAVLLKILPGPHRPADFLVIGTLATLATLAAVGILFILTLYVGGVSFYRLFWPLPVFSR